jgi:hypothetical protein
MTSLTQSFDKRYQFEVSPTSSSDAPNSASPTHFYVDLISTGSISLTPPAVLKKHSHDSPSSTWTRRNVIIIKISDRDLLAVAIGERVPVKLFSDGRLRIKVSRRESCGHAQKLKVSCDFDSCHVF